LPGGAPQEGECRHRKQSPGLVGCQLPLAAPEVQRSSAFTAMRGGDGRSTELRRSPVEAPSNEALQATGRRTSPGSKS
jgi:hypothetical protein